MICGCCTPRPLGIGGDLYTETYDYYELRDLRLRGLEGGNIDNISYRDILMAPPGIGYLVAILGVPA
eukprot:6212535-Pleurochrysis_carterae.AAC.1